MHLVAAIAALQLVQILFSLWLPSINATIIDDGVLTGNTSLIWAQGSLMLVISLLQITAMAGAIYLGSKTAMSFGRELRRGVFSHVQSFSATDAHRYGAPSLITRATNDIQQIQMVILLTFTIMVMAPIMGVGGVVMAVRQDAKLAWVLAIAVPVLFAIIGTVMYNLIPTYKVLQERIDAINTRLREQLTGVRVIRAFVRQRSERTKFEQANSELRSTWLKIGLLWAVLIPASQLVVGLSSIAVVWFGGHRIADGQMQIGSLTAYISYLMMILMSVMMSGMMAMLLPRGEVSAKRVSEILETTPSIAAPTTPTRLPTEPLTFEFDHVSLQYPGASAPVFHDVSLAVSPGKTLGIIGSTGSGKTSLLRLFPRLIDVTAGEVRAGGIPVRELDPAELRSRIAVIPQKAFLFTGTVASNVAGHVRAGGAYDAERVTTALKAADAWEFVSKLDDGLDAKVESGGKNFSGGQRQRLTIARAIYKALPGADGRPGADLIVFDDSFSALDYATDARLRAGLPRYLGNVAVVIVAARVSTIRHADEIIVLDDGGVVGRGTHEELNATCGVYQEIVDSQMSTEEAA
ncbi:ATP-binding cassette subfamily B protein [Arcanobacterium wilhelmae]|uniref:ATP-binding cassette subfamily B protein n=1 Tax=Arcanobacterium wilhelmae TaxID=1803177 RepID=A0ABT9N934_9ACTO|nr:ABC transporter ATP-binding protein [Arcanobacterium wilhelmae]MDP9800207.1 ATP-binding cassette subfamily B protein [Arcanobacterium wilhelmae]WFN89648.1 ABC transporter ATP-binding protein [Arcanobacterium wilhelmae]